MNCISINVARGMAVVLGLLVLAASASGLTIVGWDADRGGQSSLAKAQGYAQTRAMIEKNFPKSTIVGAAKLTDEALEKADVVWIGIVHGDNKAIEPLSADEQAALMRFIKRGGVALLFGDNDSFDPAAIRINASLLDPFKVKMEGTVLDNQPFTIAALDKAPFDGPFGKVTSLSGGYTGWFAELPKEATPISKLNSGKPIIAVLPSGAVEKNSGAIWLFGNSGDTSPGGGTGGEWDILYANILSSVEKK